MDPGGTLFDGFGHASLRVADPITGEDLVYSFGALTWTGPLLGWRFLRGEVLFELRVRSYERMLRSYVRQDRSIYRQILLLEPEEARDLAERLEENARPENAGYPYHHFHNNCATRIRDLVDEVTRGALKRSISRPGDGSTARQHVLEGLSLNPGLLLIMNIVLGRMTDRPLSVWDLCFVPIELRGAFAVASRETDGRGRPLAGPVELVYQRRVPLGRWPIAWGAILPWIGAGAFLLLGLALHLLSSWRYRAQMAGAGLALWALAGGMLGLSLASVALSDYVPQFRRNENLALFVFLDLWLLWPAVALLRGRAGRLLRPMQAYLAIRAFIAGVVLLAQGTGLLVQGPLALAGLVLAACGGLLLGSRRVAPR